MHLRNIFNLKCNIAVACQVERKCCARPHCAVPENIHIHPKEGQWKFRRRGRFQKPKALKGSMKLNRNFQGSGGRVQIKNRPWEAYGYFLEQHITWLKIALHIPTAHDFRVISARSRARAHTQHIQNGGSWLARDKSSFFLGNEYQDLTIFLFSLNAEITFRSVQ